MRLTKRLGIIAASTLISAGVVFAASAVPAKAATTPVFCNGNYLCAEEVGQSIDTMYIDMWPSKYSFVGHFELQTPSTPPKNTGNTRNYPSSPVAFAVPIVYGKYCATAWKYNGGSSYTKLGYLCFIAGA